MAGIFTVSAANPGRGGGAACPCDFGGPKADDTATPEGLGNLLAVMGAEPDLYAMYDGPQVAFSREGRVVGNAALARMFGSPSRRVGRSPIKHNNRRV